MNREGTLKALLVFLGLLFSATVYPLILFLWQAPSLAMMLGLYVTLGVFLLLAARDPSAHRSLLAFTAWSSFAHGDDRAIASYARRADALLIGSALLVVIGLALVALAPARESKQLTSAAPPADLN